MERLAVIQGRDYDYVVNAEAQNIIMQSKPGKPYLALEIPAKELIELYSKIGEMASKPSRNDGAMKFDKEDFKNDLGC